MTIDQRQEVQDKLSDAVNTTEKVRSRISRMYHGKVRPTFRELLQSPSLILVTCLKLLRLLFLYLALDFGERSLQTKYARQVYGKNMDPPHPLYMILIAMAVEGGLNLFLLLFLYVLKLMFGSTLKYGNARLDKSFLFGYALDYVVTSLILLVVAAIVSNVIVKKKYFRYRYEGERGIRALSSIVMTVAVPIYLIPFARVV